MPRIPDDKREDGFDKIARSLHSVLVSPNVADSNMEDANVVDVIQYLANATAKVAYALTRSYDIGLSREDNKPVRADQPRFGGVVSEAICMVAEAINNHTACQDGLHRIADAINNLAQAVREVR